MFAQLTAFEVLAFVLVFSLVGALAGWAGGKGAVFSLYGRIDRAERFVLQLVNRERGAAGQAQTQVTRARKVGAEAEAEKLAADLAKRRGVRQPVPLAALANIPEGDPREAEAAEALTAAVRSGRVKVLEETGSG